MSARSVRLLAWGSLAFTVACLVVGVVFQVLSGFDVGRTAPGMGLQIMQDRVDALDGSLATTSVPGRGTTGTGRVPARALEEPRGTMSPRAARLLSRAILVAVVAVFAAQLMIRPTVADRLETAEIVVVGDPEAPGMATVRSELEADLARGARFGSSVVASRSETRSFRR